MTTKPNKGCCEWQKTPCMVFNGCLDRRGYGRLTVKGVQFKAHSLAVLLSGRKIPVGMVCDHLCKNTSCINPEHLDVVTNAENVMRGDSFSPKNKAKDCCLRGHPYSKYAKYTMRKNGRVWRECRMCISRTGIIKINEERNK